MGILTGIGGGILREAIVQRQAIAIRDRNSMLKPAVVAVLCTFSVILGLTELGSIVILAAIHFALGERLCCSGKKVTLQHPRAAVS